MALRTVIAIDNESFTFISGDPRYGVGDALLNNSDIQNGAIFEYQGGVPQDVVIDNTFNTSVFYDAEEADPVVVDGSGLVANGT